MNEMDLKLFIDIVVYYFQATVQEPAATGDALIEFRPRPLLDFSGFVELSGAAQGCVYLTMPREMPARILKHIGEKNLDDANLLDMAGEMTSTITSNAREYFGSSLKVSTPKTVLGDTAPPCDVPLPQFVLPIRWDNLTAYLGIAIYHE